MYVCVSSLYMFLMQHCLEKAIEQNKIIAGFIILLEETDHYNLALLTLIKVYYTSY